MLVFALDQMHLSPTMFEPVIFFLLLAKISFFVYLCIHMREWISQNTQLIFSCFLCGLLLISDQA